MKNNKTLTKSKDKVFLGIIGGIADYFHFNIVLARLVFIVVLVFTGVFPFALVYLLAALVMPDIDDSRHIHIIKKEDNTEKEKQD
jgi:phage shock protein C